LMSSKARREVDVKALDPSPRRSELNFLAFLDAQTSWNFDNGYRHESDLSKFPSDGYAM
jgi:hypothetical protein